MPRDDRELEHLLGDTRWVRAVAGRLCADTAAADDLAQEAWVAALRSAPTSGGSARRWFARVLANLARQRGRSETARRAREIAVGRERALGSQAFGEDLVARADASRRLVDHVLALDEPYRSTLLARYFDDLEPAEIARRTGTNASTVRTRLERGLARLRARLEREDGTGWLAAIVPLAPPAPAAAVTALLGGWVMTMSTKIALALAAAAAVVWLVWPTTSSPPLEKAAIAVASEELELEAPPRTVELSRTSAPTPALEAVPSVATAPSVVDVEAMATETESGFLAGIVVRDCVPVTRGTIWYWRRGTIPADVASFVGDVDDGYLASTPIDSDGRFRAGPLATNTYTLAVDLGAGVGLQTSARVDAQAPGRRVVLELGCARIEGHVYDEHGLPISGAVVRVSNRESSAVFDQFGFTGVDGRYEIRDLSTRARWIALDSAGHVGINETIEGMRQLSPLGADEVRVIDFGSPDRAVVWRGRVRTNAGATSTFGGTLGWTSAEGSYWETPVARDAAFELRVRPGTYELQVKLSTTDWGVGTEYLSLGTFEVGRLDFERDLVLPGTGVHGTLIGMARADMPAQTGVSLLDHTGLSAHSAQVDERGGFLFLAVLPGRYRVVSGPVLTVSPETWIDVREGDLDVAVDVPVQRK